MHMNVLFFVCLQYDVLLKKRNQMDLDMAPLKVRKKKKIIDMFVAVSRSSLICVFFFFNPNTGQAVLLGD